MMRRLEHGTTTVEFSIIGLLLMIVVFAVIEYGRALYVMNMLTEATRRGARMAVVCPVNDPKPAEVAVFGNGSSKSAVVAGLTTANVQIQYLNSSGGVVANPSTAAGFAQIQYINVSIIGFSQSFVVPTRATSLPMNGFSTTLPRESLGVTPTAVTPC